jgi:hypothetical protein
MDKKRMDNHIKGFTQFEIVGLVKDLSKDVHNTSKKLKKSLEAELNTPIHSSRSRRTTVFAMIMEDMKPAFSGEGFEQIKIE